jgi:hypothetical protein
MHNAAVVNQTYDASSDTTTAALVLAPPTSTDCNCIMLSFANASTHAAGPGIKALQILQPGYSFDDAAASPFSSALVSLLSRVDVLRFMDWAKTNGNLIEHWADRPTPASYTYAGASNVPWEVIFQLANQLNVDAWINVPAHADDDYVKELALLGVARLTFLDRIPLNCTYLPPCANSRPCLHVHVRQPMLPCSLVLTYTSNGRMVRAFDDGSALLLLSHFES